MTLDILLTDEEQELITELSDVLPVVVKVQKHCLKKFEQRLLTADTTTTDRDVVMAKARYEGARSLAHDCEQLLLQLKKRRLT